MSEKENEKVKKYTPWVWTLSIAIPVVVAILFLIKIKSDVNSFHYFDILLFLKLFLTCFSIVFLSY